MDRDRIGGGSGLRGRVVNAGPLRPIEPWIRLRRRHAVVSGRSSQPTPTAGARGSLGELKALLISKQGRRCIAPGRNAEIGDCGVHGAGLLFTLCYVSHAKHSNLQRLATQGG
jgi:hypothetical protein